MDGQRELLSSFLFCFINPRLSNIMNTISHVYKMQISFSFTVYADAEILTTECHWQYCQIGQWLPDTADCQSDRPDILDRRLRHHKVQHQRDRACHLEPCLMPLSHAKHHHHHHDYFILHQLHNRLRQQHPAPCFTKVNDKSVTRCCVKSM